MTLTTEATTEQLIKQVTLAFLAQVTLTSIHHVYGGVIYDSVLRLSQPIFASIEFLIVLGILFWYRRTKSRVALTLFSVLIGLIGIVQGLFHAIYGHVYKDILFLIGVKADMVRNFFFPVMPNDFIYPPNNIFFEATGLLELVTIYLITIFTYRLIRNNQSDE
jgi:hypothetical protein